MSKVLTQENSVCQTVIEAIADAEGADPTELNPPLYEAIDPDALENLFDDGRMIGKIIFNYHGYEVSVFPDGYVSINDHGP